MIKKTRNLYGIIKLAVKHSRAAIKDSKKKKSDKEIFENANRFYRSLLNYYGVEVKISGKKNLIKGPAILLQNHTSATDIPSIVYLPGIKYFFAKKELFKYPFFGKALEAVGMPSVDRSDNKKAIYDLFRAGDMIIEKNKGVESIEDSSFLIVYGQGTRQFDYKMENFKEGAFVLSIRKNLPIIPIVSYGALEIAKKKSFDVKGGIIYLKILPAIYPEGYFGKKAPGIKMTDAIKNITDDSVAAMKSGIDDLIRKYGKKS